MREDWFSSITHWVIIYVCSGCRAEITVHVCVCVFASNNSSSVGEMYRHSTLINRIISTAHLEAMLSGLHIS